MSLDMILMQMKSFLIVALPCAIVITGIIYAFFRYIRKKNIPLWKIIPGILFVLNFVFIIHLTLLTRSEDFGEIDLHLFRSYREAWNTFSIRNWQLIIFNIIVFLPCGTLLPILFKKFRRFLPTVGSGFLFSLSIETIQRVTERGLFEADDLFHNTLGVLLGYCIFRFFYTIFHKEKWKPVCIVASLLPFLILFGAFGQIFYTYYHQPYGNLPVAYTYKVDLSNTNIKKKDGLTFQKTSTRVPLLISDSISKKDAQLFAAKLLDHMGISGTSRYSAYDDSIVCYRGNHNVVVYLKDGSYEYHDMNDTSSSNLGDMNLSELKERLDLYHISIPKEAVYTHPTEGSYVWTIQRSIKSGNNLAGTLTCITTKTGEIYSITNQMVNHSVYKNVSIISEQEAYNRLIHGYFQINPHDFKIKSFTVNGTSLTYSPDTKGYYQPVFLFHCKINGENKDLVIPALDQ